MYSHGVGTECSKASTMARMDSPGNRRPIGGSFPARDRVGRGSHRPRQLLLANPLPLRVDINSRIVLPIWSWMSAMWSRLFFEGISSSF
jgi:hypothetical protein